MTITIRHTLTKGEITEGYVTIDGLRICDTLENSYSRLAAGTYTLELVKCKQYARKMIIIKDNPSPLPLCHDCKRQGLVFSNTVLPRACPQLKPGNGIHNRQDGSIIVGTRACRGCIIHPRKAFGVLYERIRRNIDRGNAVTLEII